jgi:acyl carrier protein
MLVTNRSGLGVMELDWRALSRFLPSAGTPKFRELARHTGDNDGDEDNTDNIHRMLVELSDAELLTAVTEMLKGEVGEILQISPDKIDPARSMYDMGLDSLMGVELVVALESRFSTRLPVMALNQNPTIAKLAEQIIQQLKGSDETEAASDETEIVAQTQQLAFQHGVDASAESIVNFAENLQSRDAAANDKIIN